MAFDWHSDPITRQPPLDAHYRNTQNARRFMTHPLAEPADCCRQCADQVAR